MKGRLGLPGVKNELFQNRFPCSFNQGRQRAGAGVEVSVGVDGDVVEDGGRVDGGHPVAAGLLRVLPSQKNAQVRWHQNAMLGTQAQDLSIDLSTVVL